jgi:hypothetical protein
MKKILVLVLIGTYLCDVTNEEQAGQAGEANQTNSPETDQNSNAIKLTNPLPSNQSAETSTNSNNNYIGDAGSYKNIPNLLVVMETISTVYNSVFKDMPVKGDEIPKDTTTQIKEGLLMYGKIRNFIVAMTVNRDELKKDIEFVKNNFNQINLSHEEVLGFYDLKTSYDTNTAKILDKNSADYKEVEKAIRSETTNLMVNIKNLSKDANSLLGIDDIMYQETEYIRNNLDDDKTLDAIKKVDATILLLPKLIDLKAEIDLTLESIKNNLNQIQSRRSNLVALIDDLDKISKGLYTNNNPLGPTSSKTVSILFTSFLFSLGFIF